VGIGAPSGAHLREYGSGWDTSPVATLSPPTQASGPIAASVTLSGSRKHCHGCRPRFWLCRSVHQGSERMAIDPTSTLTGGDNGFGGPAVLSGNTLAAVHETAGGVLAVYIYTKGASGWTSQPTAIVPDPRRSPHNKLGGTVAFRDHYWRSMRPTATGTHRSTSTRKARTGGHRATAVFQDPSRPSTDASARLNRAVAQGSGHKRRLDRQRSVLSGPRLHLPKRTYQLARNTDAHLDDPRAARCSLHDELWG